MKGWLHGHSGDRVGDARLASPPELGRTERLNRTDWIYRNVVLRGTIEILLLWPAHRVSYTRVYYGLRVYTTAIVMYSWRPPRGI